MKSKKCNSSKSRSEKYIDLFGKQREILKDIEKSEDLKVIWASYVQKFSYAEGIQFSEITDILREIII